LWWSSTPDWSILATTLGLGIRRRDQAGEGTNPGEAVEAVEITGAGQDLCSQGHPDAWGRGDDAGGVGLFVEGFDTVV